MSAKLEKYLRENRENLDVESPDDSSVWAGIKKDLHTGMPEWKHSDRKLRLIRIRNIAAIGIIIFSLGYIANDIINGKAPVTIVTLSSINSDLGQREKDYKTQVNFKTSEVSSFTGSDDMIIRQLFEEIKKLDVIYAQAMTDLQELGPNEKVINTIFDTYEQRIRLLELIILETRKINSHENNEKIIL